MPAKEDQIFFLRQFLGNLLIEGLSLRSHVKDAGTLSDTLTKRLVGITHRSRLHHHACSAAIWGIIHMAVLFFRVIPDIDRLNGKQAFSGCPSDDAGIQAV